MKGKLRIDRMYAYIVLDEDGTEGIPAMLRFDGMMVPMVGADLARMESLRGYVLREPMLSGKRITLAVFSERKLLEVIDRTPEKKTTG